MDYIFHTVPSKEIAEEQIAYISSFTTNLYGYSIYLGPPTETTDKKYYYIIPNQSTLDAIPDLEKPIKQEVLKSLIKEYEFRDTRPPLPSYTYKIGDILKGEGASIFQNPSLIDINKDLSVKLKKKLVFDDKGWVVKKEYYKEVDVTLDSVTGLQNKTYTDLVLEETRTYNLDENKNLSTRDLSIGYADNRGNTDVLVEKVKNYTEFDEREEAQMKRRVNVIDAILGPFVLNKFKELGITANFTESDTNLKLFTSELGNEIAAFKNYSDYDSLVTGVQNLTFTWLDTDDGGVTFKQRIIDKINASKL